MHEALNLLAELGAQDVNWILESGVERQVGAGTELLQEGRAPDELLIVLDGLCEVHRQASGTAPLATIGPGELLGELSFLEDSAATATVTAAESTRVLVLPRARLSARVAEDPAFAAGLYRALGRVVARRLRERDGVAAGAAKSPDESAAWRRIAPAIAGFKELMARAEHRARGGQGQVPDDLVAEASVGFDAFCRTLNAELGDGASIGPAWRKELGLRVQHELHPYLLLTRIVERIYSKPRGYAGDYLTIEWMYRNEPGGGGRIGPLIDQLFLERPAAKAVRNRRGLLAEEIGKAVSTAQGTARVTSLACGPAEELFDVFRELDDPARLAPTLIDIDLQALALVSDRAEREGLKRRLKLQQGNLVYLATGRQELDLPEQDLVYSIGLIDYFDDRFVVALLSWIHGKLRPGGRVVLGNFHPDNPDKALMDHVLDWQLIHRTEEDMHRLLRASAFEKPCAEIRFEDQRVNLFAVGVK